VSKLDVPRPVPGGDRDPGHPSPTIELTIDFMVAFILGGAQPPILQAAASPPSRPTTIGRHFCCFMRCAIPSSFSSAGPRTRGVVCTLVPPGSEEEAEDSDWENYVSRRYNAPRAKGIIAKLEKAANVVVMTIFFVDFATLRKDWVWRGVSASPTKAAGLQE
jgi:hypothetical protein